jgi:hypothetical protein
VRKQWQLTRAEWDALPYAEQLEMRAEYDVTNDMETYEAHMAEKRAKSKQRGMHGI